MRIGVVADTHVGEHLPELPDEVLERFEGVDLILHAGDIAVPRVLDALREVAPVAAVRGNHDRGPLRRLPRRLTVQAGGARIGLVHGTRRARWETPSGVLSVAAGRPVLLGFARQMAAEFRDADVVVTGHLHMAIDETVGGVRVFSPGAVYTPEMKDGTDMRRLGAWAYRRYRKGLPDSDRRGAIGLLEAGPGGVTARRIELERPVAVMPYRRAR